MVLRAGGQGRDPRRHTHQQAATQVLGGQAGKWRSPLDLSVFQKPTINFRYTRTFKRINRLVKLSVLVHICGWLNLYKILFIFLISAIMFPYELFTLQKSCIWKSIIGYMK